MEHPWFFHVSSAITGSGIHVPPFTGPKPLESPGHVVQDRPTQADQVRESLLRIMELFINEWMIIITPDSMNFQLDHMISKLMVHLLLSEDRKVLLLRRSFRSFLLVGLGSLEHLFQKIPAKNSGKSVPDFYQGSIGRFNPFSNTLFKFF